MAATQNGTSLSVGFGSNLYLGAGGAATYLMENVTIESIDDVETIKDNDGATETKILKDAGTRISFTAVIPTTGGTIVPLAVGSDCLINTVTYFVESCSVAQTTGAAKLTVTAVKEGSMSYA